MNHCMLMAEITVGPQLRYTQDNQTPIAELTIVFPGIRPEDPPQQMKAIGWGNLAQEIQEQYQSGDRILIEGRLTMNTVDRPEGFKEKQAELTVQKIHRLSNLATVEVASATSTAAKQPVAAAAVAAPAASPTATAQPTTAGAPAEPEVDYDDIPF